MQNPINNTFINIAVLILQDC